MTRALVIIRSAYERDRAMSWVRKAPWGTRIEFMNPKRTVPQSDKMWAMLTEIATQKLHCGLKLVPNDWKKLFLSRLSQELRIVPNLDSTGFVDLGQSSSKLSKEEMSNMIELLYAWGAQNEVTFKGDRWDEPTGERE
jgi:hypothetical protein